MAQGNYEKILERIARSAGLMKEDVEKKVEVKREKLSGLISKEGAAQVVASELGVSFEGEKLMIDELLPGMRNVNIVGKVINLTPVRTFKTKRGEESKVTNLWIADETSNIRAVLWDTNHIELIEKGDVKEGSVVEISNGSMRDNELHLGSFSEFKLSSEDMDDVKTEKIVRKKNIVDFKKGENTSARAFVVQIFEPRFFHVCPECKRKVVQEGEVFSCGGHGKVIPEKRALVNLVLDDGTESIRSVVFHEKISSLGLTDLENSDLLTQQKQNLLGKEMLFAGNVRNNAFFNTPEFIIDEIKELNLDEVIQSLEK
jgi:replication factor A1